MNSPIFLSDFSNSKFFKKKPDKSTIIKILSDIKHRSFPRPFERLALGNKKQQLIGAEIGVNAGHHALSMLKNLNIKRLYLIDPYELYKNYQEGNKQYGKKQKGLKEAENYANSLLVNYKNKVKWIKMTSQKASKIIDEKLDFVYIDGNHQYNFVKSDIQLYWPLIKRNGVLGGHDFYNGYASDHDGVIKAVIKWVTKTQTQLKVELPDWWIIKR